MIHDVINLIWVSFSWRGAKNKKTDATDKFVHVSYFILFFYPQRTWRQARDNSCFKHDRTKFDCPFVVPGTWYVSPSPVWMDERRRRRKPRTEMWLQNKRGASRAERWQLIKGRARNVAVINYAEGSIVWVFFFCCLLLQIIGRFKDMLGGGSSRLFIVLCLLPPCTFPFSSFVMVAFELWSTFTIPFSLCYVVPFFFPSATKIKAAKVYKPKPWWCWAIWHFAKNAFATEITIFPGLIAKQCDTLAPSRSRQQLPVLSHHGHANRFK